MTLSQPWPRLEYAEWSDTWNTLHRWVQIVGKVRTALTPWINHSWHVPLYVTTRGLTTTPIPYGYGVFELTFDFIDHVLLIQLSDGQQRALPLQAVSVAEFYRALFSALHDLGLHVTIHGHPNELEDNLPFAQDDLHASYDPDAAHRFWLVLLRSQRVFQIFRARFMGKCSPVHFFWGSGDLALTRFSGRTAPTHPGGILHLPDWVAQEAYTHEVSSVGFWPGAKSSPFPLFYSYAYPEPAGFPDARVLPVQAYYSAALREYVLPYEAVRAAANPDETLLTFLQTTYEAAATLGAWNRTRLEQDRTWQPPGDSALQRSSRRNIG